MIVFLKGLSGLGYDVDYQPNITLSEVDQCIAKLSGIVINSRTLLPKERLEKATSLRLLHALGQVWRLSMCLMQPHVV